MIGVLTIERYYLGFIGCSLFLNMCLQDIIKNKNLNNNNSNDDDDDGVVMLSDKMMNKTMTMMMGLLC